MSDKINTTNRKWDTIKEAKKLYEEGNTKTYVAKKLDITRLTLNTYLSLKESPIKDISCILDNYISLIKKLIIEGKKRKKFLK